MKFLVLFISITLWGASTCLADDPRVITFGPGDTQMTGSVPYSVIGQYRAQFKAFEGRITLDEKSGRVESVYLEIEARSIGSNCPWCDKVARSRRLLNTARYPKIIFISDKIIQDESGYKVMGVLVMHGIKRRTVFPFKAGTIIDQRTRRRWLDLKGNWRINRKDFKIIWSKLLDRRGVVVGDYLTVNWGIKVRISS